MNLLVVKDRLIRKSVLAVLSTIVLINYMPLIVGRLLDGHPIYNRISSISLSVIFLLCFISGIFILLGYFVMLIFDYSLALKLSFSNELKFISFIYLPSFVFVLINFDRSTRYTSGGYTPFLLIAYTLVSGVGVYLILRLLKQPAISRLISFKLKITFIAGQFMLVDGFGPALILLFMIVLLFDFLMENFFMPIVSTIVLIVWSFSFRYQADFSFDLLKDVVWRFAIRMESFVNHVSGESVINDFSSYVEYYFCWLQDRLGLIYSSEIKNSSTYKSLSESIYQDLYRGTEYLGSIGGSSPGIFYWLYLTYGGAVLGLVVFYLILKNYMAFSKRRNLFYVLIIAYLVNEIVSDVSEVVLILSPSFVYFMLFVIASLFVAQEEHYEYQN